MHPTPCNMITSHVAVKLELIDVLVMNSSIQGCRLCVASLLMGQHPTSPPLPHPPLQLAKPTNPAISPYAKENKHT